MCSCLQLRELCFNDLFMHDVYMYMYIHVPFLSASTAAQKVLDTLSSVSEKERKWKNSRREIVAMW